MSLDVQRRRVALGGAALLAGCAAAPAVDEEPAAEPRPAAVKVPVDVAEPVPGLPPAWQPPASPREFRAAWVASVTNIDWPSKPGLPVATWRAEAIAMLDRAQAIGLNAIVLQVRPAGDALYASALEPWSEYLTGTQGLAPEPPEDPLALWVEQAHRRGLELHAWFNPYRARHSTAKSPLSARHIARTRPQAVRRYGDQWWMDPAEPEAAAQTLAVVSDVVRRYDIDGVHIDDYFYPYPVSSNGAEQPFPDDSAWLRYLEGGGSELRADWRRAQVNRLVQSLHQAIHRIKPQLRFGISPFGIGKPALRPAGIAGFSQYDQLYADVELWLQQGWLDYLAPQLYWPRDRSAQAFEVLLDYWLAQNRSGRHIWPGLFTSMIGAPPPAGTAAAPASTAPGSRNWPAAEVLAQVAQVRARPEAMGHLHFSMVALMQDRDGIATRLRAGPYRQPALVPASPWLGGGRPLAPRLLRLPGGGVALQAAAGGVPATRWSVWRRRAGQWQFDVLPAAGARPMAVGTSQPPVSALAAPPLLLPWSADDDLLVVRGVDGVGHEGEAAVLRSDRMPLA